MALAISGIPMLTGDEALAFREKAEETLKKLLKRKVYFFRIPPSPFSQRELHIPLQASALLRRERM